MRLKNDNADSHLEELSVYADLEQPMWLTSPQTLSHDCIVSLGYFRSLLFYLLETQKRLDFVWIHHCLALGTSKLPASSCIVFIASLYAKSISGPKYITISSGKRRGHVVILSSSSLLKTKNVSIPPPPKNCCCFACRPVYADHSSKMDAQSYVFWRWPSLARRHHSSRP